MLKPEDFTPEQFERGSRLINALAEISLIELRIVDPPAEYPFEDETDELFEVGMQAWHQVDSDLYNVTMGFLNHTTAVFPVEGSESFTVSHILGGMTQNTELTTSIQGKIAFTKHEGKLRLMAFEQQPPNLSELEVNIFRPGTLAEPAIRVAILD